MGRLIVLFISIIVVTFFIVKAFWLQLNGTSTVEIINRLPVLFTPSNYVFIIWFFVFAYLFIWAGRYVKKRQSPLMITQLQVLLFVITVIFQITSIFSWHNDQIITPLVLLGLQLLTLFILYLTYPLNKESIKVRNPIAVYFSWTLFLFILIFCYVLVDIQWHGFGLSNALWAVLIMTFGTAIMLHLRYHHHDITSPIVFIWCYIGIAIANGLNELLVATAALFLSAVMIVGILFIRKTQFEPK